MSFFKNILTIETPKLCGEIKVTLLLMIKKFIFCMVYDYAHVYIHIWEIKINKLKKDIDNFQYSLNGLLGVKSHYAI